MIQVAREVDARQQHVQPVGAAGFGQPLGGEELGDRVLVLEGLPERLRVALALPEPPSQRLDRPLTDRVVGVVDQPGQDGIDLLPPRPSRPRQQSEQVPGVGRGREAIHEAGQDGVVPRELLLLPGAIRTLVLGVVDPLVVAADRDQGADRGVAALAVLVHERQQPVDDLGAAEPADGRQELVGEGRPARIVLDAVEEGPRGAGVAQRHQGLDHPALGLRVARRLEEADQRFEGGRVLLGGQFERGRLADGLVARLEGAMEQVAGGRVLLHLGGRARRPPGAAGARGPLPGHGRPRR